MTDVRPVRSHAHTPTGSPRAVGCPVVGARRCLRVFAIGPRQAEAQSAVQSECFCKGEIRRLTKTMGLLGADWWKALYKITTQRWSLFCRSVFGTFRRSQWKFGDQSFGVPRTKGIWSSQNPDLALALKTSVGRSFGGYKLSSKDRDDTEVDC